MKRIQSACICQTLHFTLKDDLQNENSARAVKDEVEQYKHSLEKNNTKYKIVEEIVQPDNSIILKVIKQYNQSPVGNYLD